MKKTVENIQKLTAAILFNALITTSAKLSAPTVKRSICALALKLTLESDKVTILYKEPEYTVSMLSVQTAGCAGMERLGVPTRTSLNTPPDERGQYICRMRLDAARELLAVRSETVIRGSSSSSNNTNSKKNSNISNNQLQQTQIQQQQNHHTNNIHSHHHQHHHLQQQTQRQQHQYHHNYSVNNYQRMTTTPNNCSSSSNSSSSSSNSSCNLASSHLSISSSGNNNNNANNSNSNQLHNNNSFSSMTNNSSDGSSISSSGGSSSSVARGGIEATTLKYGNTGSGSGSGGNGSSFGSSCGSSGSCSLACSVSSHSHDHHQHYQYQPQQQQTLCCPHHVPLPDSEWTPSERYNAPLRTSYQQSEITRSYIKPPPNKTIKDVPDHSLAAGLYLPSSYSSSSSSSTTLHHHQQQQQPKSKPNVITKFFRKSSPKSPNNLTTGSSSSSLSSSTLSSTSGSSLCSSLSSASNTSSSSGSSLALGSNTSLLSNATASVTSLTTAPLNTLPISTASTLKTTLCNYGPTQQTQHLNSGTSSNNISAGLVPSTQLLTTIGVSPSTATTTFPQTSSSASQHMERIPTPPLSVTVPIAASYHQQQKQQLHQQLLLDSLVGDSSVSASSTLQTLKSSSCSPTLAASTAVCSKDELIHMECQSGNITRNNSNTSMKSLSATLCSCQNSNCKQCNT